MVNVLFLFPRAESPEQLDAQVDGGLLPHLRTSHGVLSITASHGEVMSPGGPPPYGRIVEASFESLADVMVAAGVGNPDAEPQRQQMRAIAPLILVYEVDA